jgi:hypothetical protein
MTDFKTPAQSRTALELGDSATQNAADLTVSTATQAAIDTEASSRISGDAGLQGAIDANEIATANAQELALSADDRPGDNPDAFSATLIGAGANKTTLPAAGVVVVTGLGSSYAVTGANIIGKREPIALCADVWEFTTRVQRTSDPADPANHATRFRVQWLDKDKAAISVTTLFEDLALLVSDGVVEWSSRVSHLDVAGVTAPPATAIYAVPYIQTYGDDGVTAIDALRAREITDIHVAEIGDLSAVIAAANAATLAANNAAALVATETLAAMADVTGYTRSAGVGVISLKGGYAAFDGYGGQWSYDSADTTSASNPPLILVGSDGARYKRSTTPGPTKVTNRTALKSVNTDQGLAYLTELLRQGVFQYDSTVTIAVHQADTEERTYVAPNAAANGAWVRRSGGSPSIVRSEDVVDLRPAVAGRAAPVRRRTHLPTASLVPDEQAIHIGTPPAMVYSDGAAWWDLTAGSAVTPSWLPRGATLHVDFINSRFYWDGAVKALSDLTAVSGAAYVLNGYAAGITTEATAEIEYEWDAAKTGGSEVLFSWATGGAKRFEVYPLAGISPYLAGYMGTRAYISYPGETGGFHATRRWWPNNTSIASGSGVRVTRIAIKSDEGILQQGENWPTTLTTTTIGTVEAPTSIGFQCRAYDSATVLSDGTLRRVTIWPRKMTAAEFRVMGQDAVKNPIHLLGDSFLNQEHVTNELYKEIKVGGHGLVPLTQDGVGGSSLAEQAVRYALQTVTESAIDYDTSVYPNATLVFVDGGLSDLAEEAVVALKAALGTIQHDRWIFLQPAPNTVLGTDGRSAWDERVSKIKEFCGSHYVETLAAAQAKGDGSTADNDMIALGYWPLSLRISTTDFHPNDTLGVAFLGEVIYDAINAREYI